MELRLSLRWALGEVVLDDSLWALLESVANHGALLSAARAVGISYRHAWGRLGALERAFGEPLVVLQRGRGASLSALAETLLAERKRCEGTLAPRLRAAERTACQRMSGPRNAAPSALIVHASHDLALIALREIVACEGTLVDLQFLGSLDALQSLVSGRCHIAGFHVADDSSMVNALAPFAHLLERRGLQVAPFVRRCQGLMVRRGNPKRVRGIADVARRGVHFINRQAGAGTRLLFDRLLARSGVPADRVQGYDRVEFTHAAVAATVAAGMADVGFGVEAAARVHKLDFIALASERYFLAGTRSAFTRPQAVRLLSAASGERFTKVVRTLPGYQVLDPSKLVPARELFVGAAVDSGRISMPARQPGKPRGTPR